MLTSNPTEVLFILFHYRMNHNGYSTLLTREVFLGTQELTQLLSGPDMNKYRQQ
jgi:hypothetical protein